MDKRELLAMLTTHGITPGKIPGGIPNITQMDVAAMMSRLSDCESSLLRAKYAGDYSPKLGGEWLRIVASKGWEPWSTVRELAEIALFECVDEPRCKTCNGTREAIIDAKMIRCPRCDGLGYHVMSDRAIGRKLGFARLQEPWVTRLSWCRRKLQQIESDAVKKLS